MDRGNVTSPTDPGHHSVRVREFIDSVDDGNELLHRLAYSGYFDQELDAAKRDAGANSYKSILIASGITSLLLSTVITPLDLVVFNQLQTRLYSPIDSPALRRITARDVAKDLWKVKGLNFITGMTFAANVVRYFFTVTSMYCLSNYQKSLGD